MGRYSSMLRSPKEEQQVPDTTMDSETSRMNDIIDDVCPIKNDDDVIDILDELESIWGIEEEDNLLVEGDGIFGELELNFMEEWNDEQFLIEEHQCFKEEEEDDIDEEFYAVKHTNRFLEEGEEESSYCNVVKQEKIGFEEEEEKIPLNLNLNYQEVMDAWCNRGSLWAAEEYSPHSRTANNTFMGEVPVMEEKKMRREEKVLRYKEKRQSRLFSKKIRYQVRKLNAEKRPRLKGRFVKRVPDKIFIR